jgi:outer membrane receptor protein involved in Fe transport
VTSTIDRKVYSTARDLQSSAGSVSDVLRNVPSVEIDGQGNVSLRGDSNVQILIDGRPSTMFSGSNLAEALAQMPADSIESVEVMTNPSAQYKPDGSSGLINIITKKNRKPGYSMSAQSSAGTDGRVGAGVSATYNRSRLNLSGSFNLKRDAVKRPFINTRSQLNSTTGQVTDSEQDSVTRANLFSKIGKLNADYDLTSKDRFTGTFSYNDRTQSPRITEHNLVQTAAGVVTGDYDRFGSGHERETTAEGAAKYRHSFDTAGKEFTLDLRRSETTESRLRDYISTYQFPVMPDQITRQQPYRDEIQREATAELSLPVGKEKLVMGYDIVRDDADADNKGGSIDPVTGALVNDPSFTNRFIYGRTIHAVYGTLNGAITKKLTANLGLRLEETLIDTNQVTSGQKNKSSYFRAYPTAHFQYELSSASNLRVSYSQRVARPEPEDLNPYPIFSDPLNLRSGNPRLKPQETRSYEAGYAYDADGRSLEATLYLRQITNAFTEVRRAISPTVVLTTKDHLGKSTSAGLDFSARSKIGGAITLSLSGTAFYNKIDASNLGVANKRSDFGYTTKGSMDIELSSKDLVQISANYAGKRLTAQGYRLANGYANIGYRRQLGRNLTAVLTISDLFNSQRERNTIDTLLLHDFTERRRSRRAASLSLNWRLSGAKKAPAPKFEFDDS